MNSTLSIRKYSEVRSNISSYLTEKHDEEYALFTHYLQNSKYYGDQFVKSPIAKYLDNIYPDSLSLKWDVPFPPPKEKKFAFIDLFCGIGGFRVAMQNLGGHCLFSSDIDPHAKLVYENNFGDLPFGDIKKIDKKIIPPHDILTAGFPCQPFSISGLKKGFEDTRGTLINEVFEIIKLRSPKVVFLENVKHLVHHDKGRTLKIIIENLEKLGYKVTYKLLNAKNFGVPQNRERIIIIGHHKKKFNFENIKLKKNTVLKDFLEEDGDFEYLNSKDYTLIKNPVKQESGLIFAGYRNKKIRKAGVREGTEHLSRVHKQPNRIYSVEGTHPTLPSQESSGRFFILVNGKVRKLTINECYSIMGFPDRFIKSSSQSERYKQIGNSVCIPMIQNTTVEILNQYFKEKYE
jgi:DNA (cytosine-5)-methyltransferase 1